MRRGILASSDELRDLSKRISRPPYDTIYETLNRRCALILQAAPVTEAQWRSLWQQGGWGSALMAARTTQGRLLDLLISHHISANTAYRDRAMEELKNLISWTSWVDPCHRGVPADLCTAEAAVAATVGLDWLWDDLTSPDRLRVVKAIRTKAIDPYIEAVDKKVWWYTTYHNWNAVLNGGCGLAALALSDEYSAAMNAVNAARSGLKPFFSALGREGGWDEGTGYWGFAMRYLLMFGEAVSRLCDDRSIIHQRGMDATGLFPVYFSPNGRPASFGDNSTVPLHGALYLLTKHYGMREITWWLDTHSFRRDVNTSGWSAAGLAMLFRPIDAESPRDPNLRPVKVFHEIGWAAMADKWPKPSMYVAAKTGDLSANHSQHDMNSIQLQVDGEMLLTDLGEGRYGRKYFSQDRGEFYEVQAHAHNTVVIAERDHAIHAQGRIIEADSGENYRWVAMDAGDACGEDVEFIRHVVMVVDPGKTLGKALLVLDELTSASPEKAELFWHSQGRIDLDSKGFTGTITGRKAALRFALAASVEADVSCRTRKLDPKREDKLIALSFGVLGKVHLASAFGPREGADKLQIIDQPGKLVVRFADMEAQFKPGKRNMALNAVESG